jgi:DnaJ-class molecular chaperone
MIVLVVDTVAVVAQEHVVDQKVVLVQDQGHVEDIDIAIVTIEGATLIVRVILVRDHGQCPIHGHGHGHVHVQVIVVVPLDTVERRVQKRNEQKMNANQEVIPNQHDPLPDRNQLQIVNQSQGRDLPTRVPILVLILNQKQDLYPKKKLKQ